MARLELQVEQKTEMSQTEALVRRDVAMTYRLIAHYGLTVMTDGFVSGRLTDAPRDMIIGGYAEMPSLVRASDLHRRNLDTEKTIEKIGGVDVDAFNFSKMVYDTCPEFNAAIHAHPKYGMIFSSLDCEFDCISQYSLMFKDLVGYVDFLEQDVSGGPMRDAIVHCLDSGKRVVVLRNHGFLIPGRTVAEAFWTLARMEETAMVQVEAMQTGGPLKIIPEETAEACKRDFWDESYIDNDGTREWPAFMKMLDRMDPSYKD
ncbi:MAG: class II aldolase/adducin family protein [Caulobacterales bacterium]|nr:class II aldolase/adducin family protein [Caulobacterales bacterium]